MSRRFKPGVAARHARHARETAARLAAAEPARALEYAARAATLERQLDAAARCRECGRPLENPESIAARIGPDCAAAKAKVAGS